MKWTKGMNIFGPDVDFNHFRNSFKNIFRSKAKWIYTLFSISILLYFPILHFFDYKKSEIIDGIVDGVYFEEVGAWHSQTIRVPTIKYDLAGEIRFYTPKEKLSLGYDEKDPVKLIYQEGNLETMHIYSILTFWLPFSNIIIIILLELIVFGAFSISTQKYEDE